MNDDEETLIDKLIVVIIFTAFIAGLVMLPDLMRGSCRKRLLPGKESSALTFCAGLPSRCNWRFCRSSSW